MLLERVLQIRNAIQQSITNQTILLEDVLDRIWNADRIPSTVETHSRISTEGRGPGCRPFLFDHTRREKRLM